MTRPSPRIRVGARGLTHSGWNRSFYPADLPADWRLDYFCNEFEALLLPAAALTDLGAEEWATLAGMDPARLCLLLECPTAVSPRQLESWPQYQHSRAAGVVWSGLVRPPAAAADWYCYGEAQADGVLLYADAVDLEASAAPADGAGRDVLLVLNGVRDLRTRRRQLQRFIDAGVDGICVLLDGEPPSIAQMQALTELARLLTV